MFRVQEMSERTCISTGNVGAGGVHEERERRAENRDETWGKECTGAGKIHKDTRLRGIRQQDDVAVARVPGTPLGDQILFTISGEGISKKGCSEGDDGQLSPTQRQEDAKMVRVLACVKD
jgi:hypothetical protein